MGLLLPGQDVLQQPQEQRYQCAVRMFVCPKLWLPVCGIFNGHTVQMVFNAITSGGNTNTVRESALKADSGRKIAYRNRGLEPPSVLRLALSLSLSLLSLIHI